VCLQCKAVDAEKDVVERSAIYHGPADRRRGLVDDASRRPSAPCRRRATLPHRTPPPSPEDLPTSVAVSRVCLLSISVYDSFMMIDASDGDRYTQS